MNQQVDSDQFANFTTFLTAWLYSPDIDESMDYFIWNVSENDLKYILAEIDILLGSEYSDEAIRYYINDQHGMIHADTGKGTLIYLKENIIRHSKLSGKQL